MRVSVAGFIAGPECEGGRLFGHRWPTVNPSRRRIQRQPARQSTLDDLPRFVTARRIRSELDGVRSIDAGVGQRLPNDRELFGNRVPQNVRNPQFVDLNELNFCPIDEGVNVCEPSQEIKIGLVDQVALFENPLTLTDASCTFEIEEC